MIRRNGASTSCVIVLVAITGCATGDADDTVRTVAPHDTGSFDDSSASDETPPVETGSSDDSSSSDDTAMSADSMSVDSTSMDSTSADTTSPPDTASVDSTPPIDATSDGGTTTWTTNALAYDCTHSGMVGKRIAFNCPPAGKAGTIHGSGVYPSDSSVCTAAAHAGRITLSGGGPIEIEIRAGLLSYASTYRNELFSSAAGATICAFAVVGPSCAVATQTDCGDVCADLGSDKLFCGSCGTSCTSPLACVASVCK